jgi:beta-glucosidase
MAPFRLLSSLTTIFVAASSPLTAQTAEPARPLYLDATQPLEARLDDLLPRLTLEEKIALLHADSKFSNAGVPRLGIPKMWMSDGPHGVREEISADSWDPAGRTDDFATWLPVAINLASTWNPELAASYAGVIANEARQRNKHVMLGPGVNIQRTPLNGRTFEYFGEDPWLASRLAVAYVRGMQAGDVAACVKHFALNNQEIDRSKVDVDVDERTLREIYLPAFEAAVREAGALSVMGAYNKFRGQYCCHHDYLLNQVLKKEWGFQGSVITDWSGAHDTRESVFNGLDLEMGTLKPYDEYYLARPFREMIQRGEAPVALLDDKARRNLRVLLATKALDGRKPGAINTREHQAIARRVADEGIVLLKNEGGALPLNLDAVKTIAVIGENATRKQAHGGWSSEIKAFYEITPLEGIVRRVRERANVIHATGYMAPIRRRRGAADGAGVRAMETITVSQSQAADMIELAVAAAKQADVAIVIGGLNHETHNDTEGSDRQALELPYGQEELIRRVVAANPRTIVVLVAGSPVTMEAWLPRVPAVVQAWYPGMEGGNALAGILFGDTNPSGKLPCTFPRKLADVGAHASGEKRHYPGENGVVHYAEGPLVGYRWFDAKKIEPLFPFGYGLSYTTFAYTDLKVSVREGAGAPAVTAEFTLKNTGERAGAEVVQLYVQPVDAGVSRPEKELKAFQKILLKPGESQVVSLPLEGRAFAHYDVEKKAWVSEAGKYRIVIGSSSRDLRLNAEIALAKTTTVP